MRRAFWFVLAALAIWFGGCSTFIRQSDSDFFSKNNTTCEIVP